MRPTPARLGPTSPRTFIPFPPPSPLLDRVCHPLRRTKGRSDCRLVRQLRWCATLARLLVSCAPPVPAPLRDAWRGLARVAAGAPKQQCAVGLRTHRKCCGGESGLFALDDLVAACTPPLAPALGFGAWCWRWSYEVWRAINLAVFRLLHILAHVSRRPEETWLDWHIRSCS